jgi:cysteine desulfurase family protein
VIYLDNSATSQVKPPQVAEKMISALSTLGNGGRGAHGPALQSGRLEYDTRVKLARLFHVSQPEQIAFTSNATEGLNLVISGLFQPGDHVISTVLEHNSVLRPLYRQEEQGVELTLIPTTGLREQGILDYDALESACRPNTKAVVITHASNLTGNLTDLSRVSRFAKAHHLLLVVDGAQTAGTVPIDLEKLGVDVFCFTGHKGLLGPQGTGGVYVRPGVTVRPWKVGGSGVHSFDHHHPTQMPTALEAGTLNGHGIAGLNGALDYLEETGVENIRQREMALTARLVAGLSAIPGVTLYGDPDLTHRVAIVSMNLSGCDSGELSDQLWEGWQIATRPGAHCAPLMHTALGTEETGAVRFSLSHFNTEEEVDTVLDAVSTLAQ